MEHSHVLFEHSCYLGDPQESHKEALRKPLNEERGSGRCVTNNFIDFSFQLQLLGWNENSISGAGDFHFSWMARAAMRTCASTTGSAGASPVYLCGICMVNWPIFFLSVGRAKNWNFHFSWNEIFISAQQLLKRKLFNLTTWLDHQSFI